MATIQLRLSEQEANAVKYAIYVRLAGIRGYGLRDEECLQSVYGRLTKKNKLNK